LTKADDDLLSLAEAGEEVLGDAPALIDAQPNEKPGNWAVFGGALVGLGVYLDFSAWMIAPALFALGWFANRSAEKRLKAAGQTKPGGR
jgi:hypothetical protein